MPGLEQRIRSRKAAIAVVGLGYVGLPLAVEFARGGFKVTGVEPDIRKVTAIRKGKSYIADVSDQEVESNVREGRLGAEADYGAVDRADAVIICVPTPLRKTKDPDLSYVLSAVEEIAARRHKKRLIVLESTTYPGTCEELILPYFLKDGRRAGRDFYLAFSPERVDPGNRLFSTRNIPKIIGGITRKCTGVAALLYGMVLDRVYPVSSTRVAEMAKLLENTFRSVNIAMVNEMALICHRMDINVWEVIEAAATKPFGFMPFYPGPGLGGHCLPIDPIYLSWKARLHDIELRLIQVAAEINSSMPEYVFDLIREELNRRGKCLKGSRLMILGIAYKRDVGDTRESPALEIMRMLQDSEASVSYIDPHVAEVRVGKTNLKGGVLTPSLIKKQDCCVIATDHSCFDYATIVRSADLVIDTRNATRSIPEREKAGRVVTL